MRFIRDGSFNWETWLIKEMEPFMGIPVSLEFLFGGDCCNTRHRSGPSTYYDVFVATGLPEGPQRIQAPELGVYLLHYLTVGPDQLLTSRQLC